MSEQEKLSVDDAEGNCKQCGHPFNPHLVIAFFLWLDSKRMRQQLDGRGEAAALVAAK